MADDAWIRNVLHSAPVGVLATLAGDQPFLNSNLFLFDEANQAIYMHTARVGRTRSNVEAHQNACFTVFEMGRLLPADVALEFSVEYSSVVAFGKAQIVTDQDEATSALQGLLDKYSPHLRPGQDYRPPVPEELKRTTVIRFDIAVWSGKRKAVAPDFPGAYLYAERDALVAVKANERE